MNGFLDTLRRFTFGDGSSISERTLGDPNRNMVADMVNMGTSEYSPLRWLTGGEYKPLPEPGTPEAQGYLLNVAGNQAGIFIGPKGMTNLLGRDASRGLFSEAKALERAGATPLEIKQATNMHRGMDNRWRYEIDDSGAEYRPGKAYSLVNELAGGSAPRDNFSAGLADFLNHQDFYRAYPEIRKNTLEITKLDGARGDYSPGRIRVDSNSAYGLDEGKRITLHEITHAVQNAEKQATGGSIMSAAYQPELYFKDIAEIKDRISAARAGSEGRLGELAKKYQEEGLKGFEYNEMDRLARSHPEIGKLYKELASRTRNLDARDTYERLAGEIEARDVANRMNMTMEQRRNTMPDIRPDAIVRFDRQPKGFLARMLWDAE